MILKLFLVWVIGNYASGNAAYPVWQGWAIAAGLGCTGYFMTLMHHQIFWCALLSGPCCALRSHLKHSAMDSAIRPCYECFFILHTLPVQRSRAFMLCVL